MIENSCTGRYMDLAVDKHSRLGKNTIVKSSNNRMSTKNKSCCINDYPRWLGSITKT